MRKIIAKTRGLILENTPWYSDGTVKPEPHLSLMMRDDMYSSITLTKAQANDLIAQLTLFAHTGRIQGKEEK